MSAVSPTPGCLRQPPIPVLPNAPSHAAWENLEPSISLALPLAFSQAQKPAVWKRCRLWPCGHRLTLLRRLASLHHLMPLRHLTSLHHYVALHHYIALRHYVTLCHSLALPSAQPPPGLLFSLWEACRALRASGCFLGVSEDCGAYLPGQGCDKSHSQKKVPSAQVKFPPPKSSAPGVAHSGLLTHTSLFLHIVKWHFPECRLYPDLANIFRLDIKVLKGKPHQYPLSCPTTRHTTLPTPPSRQHLKTPCAGEGRKESPVVAAKLEAAVNGPWE